MPSPLTSDYVEKMYEQLKAFEGFLPAAGGRYLEKEVLKYISPEALHAYQLEILKICAQTLAEFGEIPKEVADEIYEKLTFENVPYEKVAKIEREVTKHDIRALVRASQEVLSEKAKSYVYLGLTSYDLINTSQSKALKDFAYEALLPKGIELCEKLIEKGEKYADTVMLARTHLQPAITTTVGHVIGEWLSGIITPLEKYKNAADELKGKIKGFVGTYAAQKLLFNASPEKIEERILEKLNLKPDILTGQVVNQHWYSRYFFELTEICAGVNKFANDLRHYQALGVMTEQFLPEQVGSSTGAHKRNPINCENIGGQFRHLLGIFYSVLFDHETDLQRDLRDSSNKRHYMFDICNTALHIIKRGYRIAKNMSIRKEKMAEEMALTQGLIIAEPLQLRLQKYITEKELSFLDAHEYVKQLTAKAVEENRDFRDVVLDDKLIKRMLNEIPEEEKEVILNPEKYLGVAVEDSLEKFNTWKSYLWDLEKEIEKYNALS